MGRIETQFGDRRWFSQPRLSSFEVHAIEALRRAEINFVNPGPLYKLKLEDGKAITFRPDFMLLELKIDGKTVQIETHASVYSDKDFFEKLNAAMKNKEFGSKNYLILITDKDCNESVNGLLGKLSLTMRDVCNEDWYIKLNDICKFDCMLEGLKRRSD